MRKYASGNFMRASRLLLIGATGLLLLTGCKKQPNSNTSSAAAPAANAPAPAQPPANSPAAPNASESSAAPSPVQSAAAPTAAPPPPTAAPPPPTAPPPPPPVYTVAKGAKLVVRLSQTISAKDNNVGDTFSGVLVHSVRVGGVPVLKAGTRVTGTVVAAKGQGRFKGAGDLGIVLNRVGSQAVKTTAYEKSVSGKGKHSAAFIGGGGGGGALIGGLAGGGKGALIGGLLGAGAGTAGAAFTGNKNVSIPAESVVSFTLTAPITVTLNP